MIILFQIYHFTLGIAGGLSLLFYNKKICFDCIKNTVDEYGTVRGKVVCF